MVRAEAIIEIKNLRNYLGGRCVHDGLNLTVHRGEIIGIIGASGCGKTTLLRSILRLQRFSSGTIRVFGQDLARCSTTALLAIQQRWGVMFQGGALFGGLSILENIALPLQTYTDLPEPLLRELALTKIAFSGLELEAALKYPSELSGGMVKRAAVARAIALDPEIIFLDEPTAGLDPKSAGDLDALVLELRKRLGLTIVMVTHDLDTLWRVPDRVIFLGEGQVLADAPIDQLAQHPHPLIQRYFSGERYQQRQMLTRDNRAS